MATVSNSLKRMVVLSFCVIILTNFFSMRLYITTSWKAYILQKFSPNNLTYKYLDTKISENDNKTLWKFINGHFAKDPNELNYAIKATRQRKQNNESFVKGQEELKNVSSAHEQHKQNLVDLVKLEKSIANATTEDKNTSKDFKEAYTLKLAHTKIKQTSKAHVIVTGSGLKRSSAMKIGILIPSCTRRIKNPVLKKLSLTTICLPSLYKTFEKDYLYQIYIGIDKGDYLESVQNELTRLFSNITVVTVVSPKNTFTRSVNAIARKAYEDGVDYFVRINDDTSFETKNWTSSALNILLKYKPPNIGVVGPTCKEGNNRILTHDMVHRTHFEIFGFYYPIYFDNWWADDWITQIYQPKRSTQLTEWIVKHHVDVHGTRYDVDMKKDARLKEIVSYDQDRLVKYLMKTFKSDMV